MEGHKLCYEMMNKFDPSGETGQHWEVEVHATPEELQTFEVHLQVKSGGGVLIHDNLWHRGLPTLNAKRRMLILCFFSHTF